MKSNNKLVILDILILSLLGAFAITYINEYGFNIVKIYDINLYIISVYSSLLISIMRIYLTYLG